MSAFQVVKVQIIRYTKNRTVEQLIGTFDAQLTRRRPTYNREEKEPGVATIEERVLKILDKTAPIEVNDEARIPACEATSFKPLVARIENPRTYPTGLQCDLATGNTQKDNPA